MRVVTRVVEKGLTRPHRSWRWDENPYDFGGDIAA